MNSVYLYLFLSRMCMMPSLASNFSTYQLEQLTFLQFYNHQNRDHHCFLNFLLNHCHYCFQPNLDFYFYSQYLRSATVLRLHRCCYSFCLMNCLGNQDFCALHYFKNVPSFSRILIFYFNSKIKFKAI